MKPFLISALILLGVLQAQAFGVLDLHALPTSPEKNSHFPKNDQCLAEFLSHSMNLLEKAPENSCSQEMITQYGKTGVFEPALLNYLFLVEKGSQDLSRFQTAKDGVVVDFDVCVDNKKDDCLLQRLFNPSSDSSLVSKQNRLFGGEKLSFLYTTQPFVMEELKSHTISMFLTKDKKVSFVDGDGKVYSSPQTLEACANEFLKNQFEFSSTAVYKYRSELQIPVTEANSQAIDLLMRDVCTLNQFSKMIRNDGKPNFFAFYIQSLNKLSQVLTPSEMTLAQDMWVLSKSKFVSFLQKKYLKEELLGGQFFVDSNLIPSFNTEFPAISTKTRRNLEETAATTATSKLFSNDEHYEAYVWTPVVLTFVVFFSVMALLQMDFSKDTLLYAKFLTNDAR